MRQIPYIFECEPYGTFSAVTPLISKGRLRIYYKGLNRNGGFITDEFSAKLEKSLPYTPVVGEYDSSTKDFKSHNMDRNAASIYGIVPEDPNTAWEAHLDKDGVTRVYLCCDVYLYTGRYDAAKAIIGKHHSMELNRESLQGDWEKRGLDEVFVYRDAYFDGLCVLGDNVEPCFEGSGFFSHETGAIKILEDYVRNKTNYLEDMGLGGNNMEDEKILDSAMEVEVENEVEASSDFEEIKVPTTDPIEDNGTEVEPESEPEPEPEPDPDPDPDPNPDPDAPTDDNPADNTDPTETSLDEIEEKDEDDDEIVEIIEEEEFAIEEEEDEDKKKKSCGGPGLDASFDEVVSYFPCVSFEFESLNNKILEFTTQVATLETKVQELESSLAVYKAKEEAEMDAQRESLIDEYSKYLSEDAIDEIRAKASDYTVENLEKELLFTAKKANPNFLKVQDGATFASLRTQGKEGIYRILEDYKQKKNR